MAYTKRNCDCCGKEYLADNRNLKRGWGLTCSKSCAAKKRERSRPDYNTEIVARNNRIRAGKATIGDIRKGTERQKMAFNRKVWGRVAPSVTEGDGVIEGITSEGYRVVNGIAYDKFDNAVYENDFMEDDHGWDSHK